MIVKPAIQWLNRNSDAELSNNITVIILAVGNNATIYPTPSPTLAVVQTALDNFQTSVAVAKDGGRSATSAKNNLRRGLVGLVRQLASYVQVACNNDLTSLMLSGFPTHKPTRSRIGVLPVPANVTLILGARSGELDASVDPVFGASTYNWKLTSNSPESVPLTVQNTASYITFSGLTPGVIYSGHGQRGRRRRPERLEPARQPDGNVKQMTKCK